MQVFQSLVNAVLVIVFIYMLAVHLRQKGKLKEEHSLTLAQIITDLCLPAIVFISLAQQSIKLDQVAPAFLMLGLELTCIAIAWGISSLLKFNKSKTGAIVFCAAFGSSTFLGYSIIMQMFPGNHEALSEAVLISEIGVGYPIFILGPILASYFGSKKTSSKDRWKASLVFFKSPVFFALVLGIIWGTFNLPGKDNVFAAPIFQLGKILASALTPLAIISVGLMFKMPKFKSIFAALIIVVLIKLIIKPLIAGYFANLCGFPNLWTEVLVLLAAMPPAILGVVFLRRYGGDSTLASTLLLSANIISCFTLLAVFWIIG
jgi:malate permease and related proteins